MFAESRHTWIIGPYQGDRQAFWESLKSGESVYEVNCHRNLRGPYTGVGTLLRQLVPMVYQRNPEHVKAHCVEILSLAPELDLFLTLSTHTLTSLAIPKERTRFYSRLRTLRLAHGIIEFLKGCISLGISSHFTFYFDQVQDADSLDQELLCELLRRVDPATLTVVLGTTEGALPLGLEKALTTYTRLVRTEPQTRYDSLQKLQSWQIPSAWQEWLRECGHGWLGEYEPLQEISALLATIAPAEDTFVDGMRLLVEQAPVEMRQTWAQAYIASDGTSDSVLEKLAYHLLDESMRQQMHDERAEFVVQQDEFSLHLGAIPYHRERGTSPDQMGAVALQVALDYCLDMGFYEATVDLGSRGRALIDWTTQTNYYWTFTFRTTTSLAILGRSQEAEELCDEARSLFCTPAVHMQVAYALSMIYTRYHAEDRRDHLLAKAWINQAIALATMLHDSKERAFQTVFNQNGLALVEVHLKRLQEALRLVSEGLERLNRELGPDEHLLHRSVLLYNRAQVYAGLGQIEEALADYTAVIQKDPCYSEYYLDRGNLYRKLERNEEALADYELAIRYSPPYPEAYYNRAGVLYVLGREDEALADYTYVLELDPTYLDAFVNCASIYYERGEYELSRTMVERGLKLEPENAQLLCTLGLLEMAEGRLELAEFNLSQALKNDPFLVAAWTNRAILAFERGNSVAAIADLTRALALEDNTTVFYNRGIAYQEQGSWREAIEDFSRALTPEAEEAQDIFYRRGFCHLQLGNDGQAASDFEAHQALKHRPA